MKRYMKAILGIGIMLIKHKTFPLDVLKGKRIALVGPASSAIGTHFGAYIDKYDLVVRTNKAPLQLEQGINQEHIGSKLDLLFHSFLENDRTGGGWLDFDVYQQLKVRYVVNPFPTNFGMRKVFNFYKKYLKGHDTYTAPKKPYKDIINQFGRYRPTTGFCGLMMLMAADFDELYITGFTFFKTPYAEGYRDHFKEKKDIDKLIKDENQHNPDIEYQQFQKLLKKNSHKKILVDKELQAILKKDGVEVKTIDYTP